MARLSGELEQADIAVGEVFPANRLLAGSKAKPQFGAYHAGDWLYSACLGVGLEFSGWPVDEVSVVELLQEHGCNPVASRRLVAKVKSGAAFKTTVSASLMFTEIGDGLARLGLRMRVVPPARTEPDVVASRDRYVLMKAMGLPAELPERLQGERPALDERVPEVARSLTAIPARLGKFGG